jgi:hypothetical protein
MDTKPKRKPRLFHLQRNLIFDILPKKFKILSALLSKKDFRNITSHYNSLITNRLLTIFVNNKGIALSNKSNGVFWESGIPKNVFGFGLTLYIRIMGNCENAIKVFEYLK